MIVQKHRFGAPSATFVLHTLIPGRRRYRATKDGMTAENSEALSAARGRPRFLRWALVNTLTAVAFVAAFVSYDGQVHAVGTAAAVVVLVLFALASGYCGLLAWRSDERAGGCADTRGLEHLALAIRICPMIAMLGTASGFLIAFNTSAEDVQQRIVGASTGIVATVVGVACTILLMLQRHLLDEQ